jgi:imidazolonepropionase-like amidohydrolase
MSRWVLCALAVVLAGCRETDSTVKALTGATLLDGAGTVTPDSIVIVDGGTIRAAGSRSEISPPVGVKETSLAGKFIVPGLVDVSTKVVGGGAELKAYPRAGVTSLGVREGASATAVAPRLFQISAQQAGFADLVIASQGTSPEETFRKIERMAKAEVDPMVILQAATKSGADWLHASDVGVLAAGKKADLLVLDADPSKDARNLRKITRVMADGKWVERGAAAR